MLRNTVKQTVAAVTSVNIVSLLLVVPLPRAGWGYLPMCLSSQCFLEKIS